MNVYTLIPSLFFGIIGMFVFREGRRDGLFLMMVIGAALMIYPYFVDGVWMNWGVGIALCAYARYNW